MNTIYYNINVVFTGYNGEIIMKKCIILASSSPRRIELLEKAGFDITVSPSDIDEIVNEDLSPEELVMDLAKQKAHAVKEKLLSEGQDITSPIVAADTIVYLGRVIGKPKDRNDALAILMELSGKHHSVYTGVCIISPDPASDDSPTRLSERCFSDHTKVYFKSYTPEDLTDYLNTDEPYDKAGAYAIQGYFGRFIDHIDGDDDNVMGLPVTRLIAELQG